MKKENVEKKDYSIEEKDQKRLKGISKALYIISKIAEVFMIIGIVGLLIAMIAVPVTTANIKATKGEEESTLTIFGNDFYYKRSDTRFELYEKGNTSSDKIEITDKSDVENVNKVFDYLEEKDLVLLTIFIEVELALFVVILFLQFKVFKKVYVFFKNIHENDSPFIKENIELLKAIGKLLIISFAVSIVASIISSIVLSSSFSLSIANIMEILVLYCGLYIFEYGYKLQNDTNGKIYS